MSAFDYKKEYKQLYQPKNKPELIQVPPMQFVAVEGKGNPNEENGAYADALALLYAISFTVKMSHLGSKKIEGYFPYVVPPLEGLWWMSNGEPGVDYSRKSEFCWISMIRLPDFADQSVLDWAKEEVCRKKKWILPQLGYSAGKKGFACSRCISARMTTSPQRLHRWKLLYGKMDIKRIFARIDFIMKFI